MFSETNFNYFLQFNFTTPCKQQIKSVIISDQAEKSRNVNKTWRYAVT